MIVPQRTYFAEIFRTLNRGVLMSLIVQEVEELAISL